MVKNSFDGFSPSSGRTLMSWLDAPLFGGGEIGLKWLVGVLDRGWCETGLCLLASSFPETLSEVFLLKNENAGTDTGLMHEDEGFSTSDFFLLLIIGLHILSRTGRGEDALGVGDGGRGGDEDDMETERSSSDSIMDTTSSLAWLEPPIIIAGLKLFSSSWKKINWMNIT